MVTVNLQDAKFEDLNIREFSQKAYRAFLPYWNGSEEEFDAYMEKNGIDYDFKASNINELGEKTDKFLQDLSVAVRRDIGKFDFRLSTALTQRNLKPIETGDYVKITLSSDEELSKDVYDSFLSFNSRSFIDFREFDPDKNELTLIYNRRGIFDENERIAILKARNSLTLSDNFQQAKDNNFILSGLCHELAKIGMDFRYEYTTTEGVTKEYSIAADKILGLAEKKEEKKEEAVKDGFDIMIVRELTGGLYFGERSTRVENSKRIATDTLNYSEDEIRRVAIKAFELAAKRKGKLTSVDKANVLDSSRLWRSVVEEVARDYSEVKLNHMLVDNCAMQLIVNPSEFDVILTENMFGDILSDEASVLTGSIGMLSSASLNDTSFGLYEPSHGSAPDIKGKGIANPIATIISAAMLLGISLGLDKERKAVEAAVEAVLESGARTIDISEDKKNYLGTKEITDLILANIN